IELRDSGYGVVFRHRDRLALGWLDRSLRPVGALRRIDAGAVAPGRPRVATDGQNVLVLFASRPPSPPAGAPPSPTSPAPGARFAGRVDAGAAGPYALYWVRARFGADPDAVAQRLATDLPGGDGVDAFAPTPTALSDGTWVVAWTSGVVEPQ